MGSSGATRPLELRRCDAKMVLMRVDFPRPVWPAEGSQQMHGCGCSGSTLTNANDVELEAALQELLLNLVRNAVETDMALWRNHLRHRHAKRGAGGTSGASAGLGGGRERRRLGREVGLVKSAAGDLGVGRPRMSGVKVWRRDEIEGAGAKRGTRDVGPSSTEVLRSQRSSDSFISPLSIGLL